MLINFQAARVNFLSFPSRNSLAAATVESIYIDFHKASVLKGLISSDSTRISPLIAFSSTSVMTLPLAHRPYVSDNGSFVYSPFVLSRHCSATFSWADICPMVRCPSRREFSVNINGKKFFNVDIFFVVCLYEGIYSPIDNIIINCNIKNEIMVRLFPKLIHPPFISSFRVTPLHSSRDG